MCCNEQLYTELICSLSEICEEEKMKIASEKIVSILNNYDVNLRETALAEYKPFPDVAKAYLVSKKIEGLANGTINLYRIRLGQFFDLVRKPINDIGPNDIRWFLYEIQNRTGMSDRTLDSVRIAVNGFFGWANNEGYITKNPCANIKAIKYKRNEVEPLTEIELEEIRKVCTTQRNRAIIEFLYSTGCRVSEMTNAKLENIDFNTMEVTVTGKGNKTRKVYLNAKAALAVREYLENRKGNSAYLFSEERLPYDKLSNCMIQRILADLGIKAGINKRVHPHMFRHTTATMGLMRGMSLAEVQNYLGHSNPATTLIYAKVADASVKNAHHKCIV